MESRKLIQAEWGITENNRRARYYRVTPAGRAHLKAENELVDPVRRDGDDHLDWDSRPGMTHRILFPRRILAGPHCTPLRVR